MLWSKKKTEFLIETRKEFYVLKCDDKNENIRILIRGESKWIESDFIAMMITPTEELPFSPFALGVPEYPKQYKTISENIKIGSFIQAHKAPISKKIGPIIRIWKLEQGETIK